MGFREFSEKLGIEQEKVKRSVWDVGTSVKSLEWGTRALSCGGETFGLRNRVGGDQRKKVECGESKRGKRGEASGRKWLGCPPNHDDADRQITNRAIYDVNSKTKSQISFTYSFGHTYYA